MVVRSLSRLLPGTTLLASASGAPRPAATPRAEIEEGRALDVCLLSYRSDPYSGGQGVYVKHLSRELVELGHSVDVISGEPYPNLDPGVNLIELPGPNVIEAEDRLRAFEPGFVRSPVKLFEWLSVLTGGFPEPYTFGARAVRHFRETDRGYDVIHDNQSLCYGLLDLLDMGLPTVATIHHPITVDRDLALRTADGITSRVLTRRWFRFLRMQKQVARRVPHLITVSHASKQTAIEDFGIAPEAVSVVHNGIDTEQFRPLDGIERRPGRVITTVSADVPLKGLEYLLRAFASVVEDHPDAELVIIGELNDGGTADRLTRRLGIADRITTYSRISRRKMIELYASSVLAVVPSLYEGFGLPAGEAMACGVPLVATDGGGLSEVVGDAGLTVPPGDTEALAGAMGDLLAAPEERERMGREGRRRMHTEFDWTETARETVGVYRQAIAHADR